MTAPEDPLNRLLDRWEKTPPAPLPVAPDVWRRLAATEESETLRPAAWRPVWSWGTVALAAIGVAVGLSIAEIRFARFRRDLDSQAIQGYLRLIDPLVEARAAAPGSPATAMSALQRDLQLTPGQLDSLRILYEQSAPHLRELAAREARLREELYAFETRRQARGEVDFLEFARFVDERRRLERECADSTRQIVDASAGVMNPRQRERYRMLIDSSLTR